MRGHGQPNRTGLGSPGRKRAKNLRKMEQWRLENHPHSCQHSSILNGGDTPEMCATCLGALGYVFLRDFGASYHQALQKYTKKHSTRVGINTLVGEDVVPLEVARTLGLVLAFVTAHPSGQNVWSRKYRLLFKQLMRDKVLAARLATLDALGGGSAVFEVLQAIYGEL